VSTKLLCQTGSDSILTWPVSQRHLTKGSDGSKVDRGTTAARGGIGPCNTRKIETEEAAPDGLGREPKVIMIYNVAK
jgi:hypothetical protein